MALDFPNSPSVNQSFNAGGKTWVYNGTKWVLLGVSLNQTVADGSITAAKLTSDSVTAAKISANAVTEAKINSGAVTQAKLTSGLSGITVTTTALRDTVIPSPFTGQFAFLTDTNAFIRWNGSAWVTAIVSAPTEAPTSLALVSATATTATISFAAGADGGSAITNYQYALSTNSGASYGSYNALNPADAASPITIPGLSFDTAYYIKLKAVNAQGISAVESSALSFSTTGIAVEYLVVAGGGGGGGDNGGGGGAGGYRSSVTGESSGANSTAESVLSLVAGTYTVTVGAGGGGGAVNVAGSIGTNSSFSTITSQRGGGGAGGNGVASAPPTSGGSGGGGEGENSDNFAGAAGTANQGFAGGTGGAGNAGGGGGGAGAVGGNASSASVPGNGGAGLASSITGSSVTRAGGGGGGPNNDVAITSGASGGSGGGGAGGLGTATNGSANTGSGGGGAGYNGTIANGGAGGSGIVIIRYLTADASGSTFTVGAGLTSATTTSGSYTVRTFTAGSGNLVIS